MEPVRWTGSGVQPVSSGTESEWSEVLPAGEFIRFVFSGLVEVQAELRVDAETEVVVHLHNLRHTSSSYSPAFCQTVSSSHMQLFSSDLEDWTRPWEAPGSRCPCHLQRCPEHPAGWSTGPSEPHRPRPRRPVCDAGPRCCNLLPSAGYEPSRYLMRRDTLQYPSIKSVLRFQ